MEILNGSLEELFYREYINVGMLPLDIFLSIWM